MPTPVPLLKLKHYVVEIDDFGESGEEQGLVREWMSIISYIFKYRRHKSEQGVMWGLEIRFLRLLSN